MSGRTLEEIAETGADYITESELARLVARIKKLEEEKMQEEGETYKPPAWIRVDRLEARINKLEDLLDHIREHLLIRHAQETQHIESIDRVLRGKQ